MPNARDTFCSHCGHAFEASTYPRTCKNAACGVTIWANPIPVSVVLQPVKHEGREGLLVVRRSIEPREGLLALVGGFLEEHETWQVGGAREIREETGVEVDSKGLEPFWFTSTEPKPRLSICSNTSASLSKPAASPMGDGNSIPATCDLSEAGRSFGRPAGTSFSAPIVARCAASASSAKASGRMRE